MIQIATEECNCYFCPKIITSGQKYVEWTGVNNYAQNPEAKGKHRLKLHAKCALSLAYRLIGDAFDTDENVENPETVIFHVQTRLKH